MSDAGTDWAARFFTDADSLQIDRLAAWFAEDIELRVGNAPAVTGKPAVVAGLQGFWSSIRGMRHQTDTALLQGDVATVVAVVTYTRTDGHSVRLPVATHLRRTSDGRLDRLWIFIELAPLFAAAVG
jgi:ketosteroid isomerase-like protein